MHIIPLLFSGIVYRPLLNGLVLIYAWLPYHDLGLSIIILTFLVRLALHPTVVSTVKTQLIMPKVQAELKEIQKKFKDDSKEQAKRSMAVYRDFGIHPFSFIVPILIQIPVFLGLFQVFRTGILLTDHALLYSFIPHIAAFNTIAFGFLDLTHRSIPLAVIAAISQFLQGRYSPKPPDIKGATTDDVARAMRWQTMYIFPIFFGGIALVMPAALALYWTALNLLAIVQQLWIQQRLNGERARANQPNP